LVRLTRKLGVSLRQSYARVGKLALIKHQRYAHAHQFKRANRGLRKLKTYLGRVIRDIERRIVKFESPCREPQCTLVFGKLFQELLMFSPMRMYSVPANFTGRS